MRSTQCTGGLLAIRAVACVVETDVVLDGEALAGRMWVGGTGFYSTSSILVSEAEEKRHGNEYTQSCYPEQRDAPLFLAHFGAETRYEILRNGESKSGWVGSGKRERIEGEKKEAARASVEYIDQRAYIEKENCIA